MRSNDIKQTFEFIKNKDPAGFDLLYEHYFRFMFSVAYSVLSHEDDCYDVIQSVMLRLYLLEDKLFPTDHELSWLKTVVKNEALMRLRKEKVTAPLEECFELPVYDQRIDDFVNMEEFNALTATLNERQRKVVTMKIMGDMTHKEIAKFLSMPIGTVQWLYNTSIKELRRAMTALAAFAVCLGGGAVWQVLRYLHPDEAPGEVGIQTVPTETVMSPLLPVSVGLFFLAVTALILFFRFSDKLPTKYSTRRIS